MTAVRVGTFENLMVKLEQDPEFVMEYRRQQPYYDLVVEIIRRRRELNITQEELAGLAGMRQSSIARLESAEHNARLETIIKVAEALDARLEIRLVPNRHVEEGEFTRLFQVKASTPPPDYVGKPSPQVETSSPFHSWVTHLQELVDA